MAETLTIDRLGARGDGIASSADGPVYVPYALPGETVEVEREGERARLLAVVTPSPERIEPFCPYFGACGGCLTQHIAPAVYGTWKHDLVRGTLARGGLDAPVAALVDAHGAGRRRLTFHARQRDGVVRAGFMAVRSHDLVDIAACPVAEPGLSGAPDAARALAHVLRGSAKPLDIQVTLTESGLDIDIRGNGRVDDGLRRKLIEAAGALDLARLSLHGEILVERRQPLIRMGRAAVIPPPGGFLQATGAGEEALAALVLEACAGAKRVTDLFSGCGPFALRLAERAEVHAVEHDGGALAALDRAFRATPGLRRITTETRDLFRRPLLMPELERAEAVVLDPPRAGCEAQARQLAASKVPVIASVSCDPVTFARDAAILVAGGYMLEEVTPVDQFKYTPHVELVGRFRKDVGRKRHKPRA